MNEDLQSRIAIALEKLMSGAPEAWNTLVNEMSTKCMMATAVNGIVLLFSVVVGILAHRKIRGTLDKDGNPGGWDLDNNWNRYTSLTCICILTALITLVSATSWGMAAMSPSVELLDMLT